MLNRTDPEFPFFKVDASYVERVLVPVVTLLFIDSVLRGIRTPGRWAATHLLFNYDFGFTKRALLGSVVEALNIPALYHYDFFFWFSLQIFIADALLLLSLLKNTLDINHGATKAAALVFASSLGVVFFAHSIGYFDQITLLVTLIALRIRGFYRRACFVAVSFSISLFIHEGGFLIFFPVLFLRFVVDIDRHTTPTRIGTLCVLASGLSVLEFCIGRTHLDAVAAEAMHRALQLKADYHLRQDAFLVLSRDIHDNRKVMIDIWKEPGVWRFFLSSLVATAPSIGYLLWSSLAALTRRRSGHFLYALVIASALAPLTLHVLGWDFSRWDTLTITTCFLTLTVVTMSFGPGSLPILSGRPFFSPLIPTALVALNLGTCITLFDNYSVQLFPFEGHVTDVIDMTRGSAPFPPRPETCLPDEPQCP